MITNFDVQWESFIIVISILFVENKFGDHDILVEVEVNPLISVGLSSPSTLALISNIVLICTDEGGIRSVIVSNWC